MISTCWNIIVECKNSSQVSSLSLDEIKYEQGSVKRQITLQEAKELGAGEFSLRLHLFVEAKDSTRVFLSILPGSLNDLPDSVRHMKDRESFPTLSYEMYDKEGTSKYIGLFPPAEPGKKYGTYVLGVINTIALPAVIAEGLAMTIDPKQYITCIR